jgi:hypothetical protein
MHCWLVFAAFIKDGGEQIVWEFCEAAEEDEGFEDEELDFDFTAFCALPFVAFVMMQRYYCDTMSLIIKFR